MALTVGTNTYISLADAETYITSNYLSTSKESVIWAALSTQDKEVYLIRSCKKIDSQRLVGMKIDSSQTLAFPRSIYSLNARAYIDQSDVPVEVKYAQVEEALSLVLGTPKRLELQRQGVKSFRLGDLYEEYQGASSNTLISTTTNQFLRPYLAGGVPIC